MQERTQAALAKARAISPLEVHVPVELRAEYCVTGQADQFPIIPGRERLDARTIAYRGEKVMKALWMI